MSPGVSNLNISNNSEQSFVAYKTYPNLALLNARSARNKMQSVVDLLDNLELDIMLLTETWENSSKNYQEALETLEEKGNYEWFSKQRQEKRGGGVSIIVDTAKYNVEDQFLH